ncbi:MAG: hypothetical protein QXN77_07805 [Candidatus Caldarchaeum sp.]
MSSTGFARPITPLDLEYFYTGAYTHPFILPTDVFDFMEVQKAAGTIETAVGGVLNRVFGALLWSQLNTEANWFGILPKMTWVRSGWRVWYAFSDVDPTTAAIGETATLPSPVRPEIKMVYDSPKIMVRTFEVTDVVEALASVSADDVWGASYQTRAVEGLTFVKTINRALGAKVGELPTAWNAFEKIDRIVSKTGEQGFTAGWEDVHGIDRSAETWANSYVDDSATLRPLTHDMILNALMNTRKRGGMTNVIVTGYETYAAMQGMYMTFVRYLPMGETQIQVGVSGIQSARGLDAGIHVASLLGIPLIQSVDTAVGTGSGELPYIYFLDTSDPEGYGMSRLGISLLRPVEYFETREFPLLNKFVVKGVYRIVGQTVGRHLPGQGKIRDITK